MSTLVMLLATSLGSFTAAPPPKADFETDTMATSRGDLKITFIGHGTLMFRFGGMVIHVDPVGRYADYSRLPKGDVILVTHEHGDHFDESAIDRITTDDTVLVLTDACKKRIQRGVVMKNGDVRTVKGLRIEAVPAYNVVHMRKRGQPFHPKGVGDGYVITFGNKRVYVAGDTENIPEMADLADVDVAFLPMNVPYTMTPEMVASAVRALKPAIVYPYHFGDTDTSRLAELLKDFRSVEVRVRRMK